MKNTIKLTKILKVGDKVWSNAIGDVVRIVSIDPESYRPIEYTSDRLLDTTIHTTEYGYTYYTATVQSVSDDAIPDLVPSKDNWDWSGFNRDLPIDTFCVVSENKRDWRLRYYAGSGGTYDYGHTSQDNRGINYWKYIIPVSKFNFTTKEFDEQDNYGIK